MTDWKEYWKEEIKSEIEGDRDKLVQKLEDKDLDIIVENFMEDEEVWAKIKKGLWFYINAQAYDKEYMVPTMNISRNRYTSIDSHLFHSKDDSGELKYIKDLTKVFGGYEFKYKGLSSLAEDTYFITDETMEIIKSKKFPY